MKIITFERMLQWVRRLLKELSGRPGGSDVQISSDMETSISEWTKSYLQHTGKNSLLELPAAIAAEFARLITLEMESELSGSPRADYLNTQYKQFLSGLQNQVEYACAKGGMVFKPYVSGGDIIVDCVQGDCFYPTAFNSSGEMIGAVFVQQLVRDGVIYTRLESHDFQSEHYTITNRAYRSKNDASLGTEISLTDVSEWADISPEASFEGLARPLFAYFRIPGANNIDPSSPLGVSVFSRVMPLIDEAEKQFARLLWEFQSGERAIYVNETALKHSPDGKVQMPKLYERLIRTFDFGSDNDGDFHDFSPAFRDQSTINGLNAILRRIEFNCNLAYGTLSDVQQTDKTAEEIRASKQRSFSAVAAMQQSLQAALEHLIYAMDVLCGVYHLTPAGKVDSSFEWDDSLVTDRSAEFAERMQLQTQCNLRPEINVAWYFGCTEEKALEMMNGGNGADLWEGV